VVSVTDPFGRILGFPDRSRYFWEYLHVNVIYYLNHWVMHPVARVSTNIVETSVRNKCRL
jgi:hypothetical protein